VLAAATRIPLLDMFGVPYELRPETARASNAGWQAIAWLEHGIARRRLVWPVQQDATLPRTYDSILADARIRRGHFGDLHLPFDPVHAMRSMLTESYRTPAGSDAHSRARAAAAYYRVRPFLPRRLQIAMRRFVSRAQARTTFPAWPVEPTLHDLYDVMLGLLAELAQCPIPYIAPWPKPYSWAFVLTHDVETQVGCANVEPIMRLEHERGLRSSWNFVPRRYEVEDRLVRRLQLDGYEIGVHGLYHDGRDLESRAMLERRLPAIRDAARRWGAVGFRAPALRRSHDLMPLLGFEYDSSYPDTDPHGPDGGGCCSWLPYFIDDLVELPVTLPQDHTLFEILRHGDGSLWLEKSRYLRGRGGMAVLITHPDYLLDHRRVDAYRSLLDELAGDATAWKPLPREVSAWWRRRSASRIVAGDDGWRLEGPAAGDGRIAYAQPPADGPVVTEQATLARVGSRGVAVQDLADAATDPGG
jgi:hypothetical protein